MFACTQLPTPTSTVPIDTGHELITELLIAKLDTNNDWYRTINQTTLEIAYPPKQYIIDFTASEVNKIIPRGRSFSLAIDIRDEVYEQLSTNNIKYHLVQYDNSEFVVWDEKNTDAVNDIIMSVAKKAFDAKANQ